MSTARLRLGSLVFTAFAAIAGCESGNVAANAPLATGQIGIEAMTTDSSYVYWTMQSGDVRRVSIDGGQVQTIATGQPGPASIAVDGTNVYWVAGDGTVSRVPKAGGDVTVMAIVPGALDIAVDDTTVYFTTTDSVRSILKTAEMDANPVVLAANQESPRSLYVSGNLIWAGSAASPGSASNAAAGIDEAPLKGGTPVSLISDVTPFRLSVAAGQLAWTEVGTGTVRSASVDGTNLHDLATVDTTLEGLDAVLSDDKNAYFTTDAGNLRVVSLLGGDEAQVILQGPRGSVRIAMDSASVYAANSAEGAVIVLPKQ